MKLISTQKDPIDVASYLDKGTSVEDGSDVVFIGRVRDHSNGKKVTHIDYEIYNDMALKELNRIADEAIDKYKLSRVIIINRYGRVMTGEISIVIIDSSSHREESYAASRYIIDEIKKRVPVWKKEFYVDGSEWISDRN